MSEKVYEESKFRQMREEDKKFDSFVIAAETAILSSILRQQQRQMNKKYFSSKRYKIRTKVDGIPITKEQKKYIMKYLTSHYIKYVDGDFFIIRKCWFCNKYQIKDWKIPKDLVIS